MMDVADHQPMNLDSPEAAKDEIEEKLRCSPRRFNISRSRWRLKDIRQVISWLRDCTLSGVHQIMKRLKISLKRATGYVDSPDPDYQLKRRAVAKAFASALSHPERFVVLFQDELTYYSQPDNALKYGPVGKQPPHVHRATTENVMSRVGAVMNGLTGQVTYLQGDKFGKVAFAKLYRQIRRLYPQRKLFVIQDNTSFHYNDNVLATAEALDIQPVFLPTYTSWLNPIEKLWRWLKADVLHGHEFAHDFERLRRVVAEFLDQFAFGSPALLRYVGLLPD